VDGELSIFQTQILFKEHDLKKASNRQLILSVFEKLLDLKINFHKSELFCIGGSQDEATWYVGLFGCWIGQFRMNYLGIPISYRRLTNVEWKHVEERLQKRLSSLKDKLLSGRTVGPH
jgi:hypothetical protein